MLLIKKITKKVKKIFCGKIIKRMPYPSEHSIRIHSPNGYTRFRRKTIDTGVDAIIGFKKGGGSEIQAIRFDKSKFSPAEAKSWAKDHGYKKWISFEPAVKSSESDHMSVADIVVRTGQITKPEPDDEDFEIIDDIEKTNKMIEEEIDMGKTQPGVPDGTGPGRNSPECPYQDDDEEMWVEAFAAGRHTDAEGKTKDWSDDDIKEIAEKYNAQAATDNPQRRIAPVVIGHPQDDSPAYGWIDKAKAAGNKLMLKLTQLQPEFVKSLKMGLYKMRSISLYGDNSIRHLGFLGGAQPAVAGLAPFKFSDSSKYIVYDFKYENIEELKAENKFFHKLFSLFKIDTSNYSKGADMPNKDIEKKEVPTTDFSEQVKTLTDENAGLKTELSDLKAKIAKSEDEARIRSYREYVDKLVGEGKVKPADVDQIVKNMEGRSALDKASNFAEGKKDSEGKDIKSELEQYKEHLSTLPKVVEFSEIVKGPAPKDDQPANFVETEIQKKMNENKTLMFHQALDLVRAEHPEKVREYIQSSYTQK